MSKRFRRLEAALKYIRPGQGGTVTDAPTGTPLRLYQDWKAGKREVTYTRDASSNPDKILKLSLNPFGMDVDPANLTIVPTSQRANTSSVGDAVRAAANLNTQLTEDATELQGFIPAKATIFAGTGSATAQAGGSKITGLNYKKRNGASFTMPYGASVANSREAEVRAAIRTALASSANATVSFKSERL